jgi:hypothetical protein
VTTWDTQVPEAVGGELVTNWPRAGTVSAMVALAAVSVTAETRPDTARLVVLVRTSDPTATWPVGVDCPVQYQADDSASAAVTKAPGATGGAPGRAVPGEVAATPRPAMTAAATSRTGHRRWLL